MKQLKLLFLCINYFFLVYIQTTLPMYLLLFPSVSFLFVNFLKRYYRYLFFLKMSLCRGTLRPPSCRCWWLGTRLTRESSAKTTSSNQRLSVPSTRSPGFFFLLFWMHIYTLNTSYSGNCTSKFSPHTVNPSNIDMLVWLVWACPFDLYYIYFSFHLLRSFQQSTILKIRRFLSSLQPWLLSRKCSKMIKLWEA